MSAKESTEKKNQGEACPWIPFRGVGAMVSAPVFQTGDAGSIPVHRPIRFHARWEFPAGCHDHAGRVRWSASPFVRRTRRPSLAPISL